MREFCYWCGAPATSREHVPPKCFFIHEVDGKSCSISNDLITVPSCVEHNNRKSGNDEYFLHLVAPITGNNNFARELTETKIYRAWMRNTQLLNNMSVNQYNDITIYCNDLLIGKSIESMARGLYYFEYKKQLKGRVLTYCGHYKKGLLCLRNQIAIELILNESYSWKTDWKGSNSIVFQYKFGPTDYGCTALLTRFYENVIIVAILINDEYKNIRSHSLIDIDEYIRNKTGKSSIPFLIGYQGYNEDNIN